MFKKLKLVLLFCIMAGVFSCEDANRVMPKLNNAQEDVDTSAESLNFKETISLDEFRGVTNSQFRSVTQKLTKGDEPRIKWSDGEVPVVIAIARQTKDQSKAKELVATGKIMVDLVAKNNGQTATFKLKKAGSNNTNLNTIASSLTKEQIDADKTHDYFIMVILGGNVLESNGKVTGVKFSGPNTLSSDEDINFPVLFCSQWTKSSDNGKLSYSDINLKPQGSILVFKPASNLSTENLSKINKLLNNKENRKVKVRVTTSVYSHNVNINFSSISSLPNGNDLNNSDVIWTGDTGTKVYGYEIDNLNGMDYKSGQGSAYSRDGVDYTFVNKRYVGWGMPRVDADANNSKVKTEFVVYDVDRTYNASNPDTYENSVYGFFESKPIPNPQSSFSGKTRTIPLLIKGSEGLVIREVYLNQVENRNPPPNNGEDNYSCITIMNTSGKPIDLTEYALQKVHFMKTEINGALRYLKNEHPRESQYMAGSQTTGILLRFDDIRKSINITAEAIKKREAGQGSSSNVGYPNTKTLSEGRIGIPMQYTPKTVAVLYDGYNDGTINTKVTMSLPPTSGPWMLDPGKAIILANSDLAHQLLLADDFDEYRQKKSNGGYTMVSNLRRISYGIDEGFNDDPEGKSWPISTKPEYGVEGEKWRVKSRGMMEHDDFKENVGDGKKIPWVIAVDDMADVQGANEFGPHIANSSQRSSSIRSSTTSVGSLTGYVLYRKNKDGNGFHGWDVWDVYGPCFGMNLSGLIYPMGYGDRETYSHGGGAGDSEKCYFQFSNFRDRPIIKRGTNASTKLSTGARYQYRVWMGRKSGDLAMPAGEIWMINEWGNQNFDLFNEPSSNNTFLNNYEPLVVPSSKKNFRIKNI